jgi:hypothetical protein
MTELEAKILAALSELEAAVASGQKGERPPLVPMFEKIDGLTRVLPPGTDPALLHYLHKKSYQKARLFLQGRDSENAVGNCGHV